MVVTLPFWYEDNNPFTTKCYGFSGEAISDSTVASALCLSMRAQSSILTGTMRVTAFVTFGQERKWTMIAAVPVTLIAILVLIWLNPHVPADLAMPVRLYTAVISLMVINSRKSQLEEASSKQCTTQLFVIHNIEVEGGMDPVETGPIG